MNPDTTKPITREEVIEILGRCDGRMFADYTGVPTPAELTERAEFTKVLKSDGRASLKILITKEAKNLGLGEGDEVVVTIRRRR